jgi:hypothetical protein
VVGGVTERLARIIGREAEVSLLRGFVSADPPAGTLVFVGGPGIGKTTLWQEAIDSARDRGLRVLVSRPSGAEARHSLGGLIDLCDGLEEHALAMLPAPQRAALEVALLRTEPGGRPPEPQAIALGFLGVVRALSANAPLVIAVDDLQWLDDSSSDVLAFAARRLEREPVAFILAKRPLSPSPLERALERGSAQRLDVGPLSFGATRHLLAARLGLPASSLIRTPTTSTTNKPNGANNGGPDNTDLTRMHDPPVRVPVHARADASRMAGRDRLAWWKRSRCGCGLSGSMYVAST